MSTYLLSEKPATGRRIYRYILKHVFSSRKAQQFMSAMLSSVLYTEYINLSSLITSAAALVSYYLRRIWNWPKIVGRFCKTLCLTFIEGLAVKVR
jgi:hypothetical protein